eukprot:TRINITY_DN19921_c0_g2_i1.p1 TRINITY_DN19921_c0_g2~~TRINITY_DN19921_c0_g2_i1.p1  ORF type:complete len:140 (-),score=10.70 TRINITY_DN19921_c0_g2_i1:69-488(-)
MTIQEFANKLNGREYRHELYDIEAIQATELGFVVVFGYSDDNTEFRGAINDEVGCYNGGSIFINADGVFEECECNCKYSQDAMKDCKIIEAVWCGESGYEWTYETDIPHATFDIMEDGEKYCRGIVFDINNLEQRKMYG